MGRVDVIQLGNKSGFYFDMVTTKCIMFYTEMSIIYMIEKIQIEFYYFGLMFQNWITSLFVCFVSISTEKRYN